MSKAEDQLAQDRSLRGTARGLFDTRVAQVKADLAARSIGGRVKAKAQSEAFKALDTGIDVAKESKGIIAATAGALLVWVFRAPLFNFAKELFAPALVQDPEPIADVHEDEEPAA
ncbi:MAG: hypothetical protein KA329_01965 [Novosphingobium sp.]|nr:hypothetical protein [Novosphingobium sp.]